MDAETSALITAINLFTIYSHRKQLFPFSWSIRVNSDDRQNWDLVEIGTTQGPGTQAPQPVGSSGQLGKEQTRANIEDLFSRHGVEFGQPDSTPHPGTCSVGAELPQDFIRQDGGPTETFSEAPGAYGCSCGDSSTRSAPYETVSALAPWPSPEVGVEMRYSDYTGLPHDLQLVVRSLVPSGRSAPGAGIQAFFGIHGYLGHQLGSHIQWTHSVRGMDGSPTALAYQLPWVVGSTIALSCLRGCLQGRDVLVCTDNTVTVAYINRQGGLRSRRMLQLARHHLIWSPKHLWSLHAIHIQECLIRVRRAALSQVDLFASPETTHCQWFYSLSEATLGTDALAHTGTQGPVQICVPPNEPTSTDTVQDQGGRGAGPVSGSILSQQDLVHGTHARRDSSPPADSSEEGSGFLETGHPLAPTSRFWKLHVWSLDGTRMF